MLDGTPPHNTVVNTVIDSGLLDLQPDTEFSAGLTPATPPSGVSWTSAQLRNGTISVTFTPNAGDEWHINGVHVIGRRAIAGGQDTCLFDWSASPDGSGPATSQKIVFNSTFPQGSQAGAAIPAFTIGAGGP